MPQMTTEKYIAFFVYFMMIAIGCLHFGYAGTINSKNADLVQDFQGPFLAYLIIAGIVSVVFSIFCIAIVVEMESLASYQRRLQFALWIQTFIMLLFTFGMGVITGIFSGYYRNVTNYRVVNSTITTLYNLSTAEAVLIFLIGVPGLTFLLFTRSNMINLFVDTVTIQKKEQTVEETTSRNTQFQNKQSVDFRQNSDLNRQNLSEIRQTLN